MSIPPPAITPGHRLDRYELLCPLAQGGMASVWVARQTGKHGFEKLVAVKMILPQYASDERFQKMFLDEAHIAAGIEHPNVAQILDLGEERGVLYLAMEWIDGDSLAKLHRVVEKKGEIIPPALVARMAIESCAGLHAAHELRGRDGELLNVVHRDVSPQNILVSTKGIAKVIDFGIAKARDRVAEDTNAGVLKGKIRYMAPEQATARPTDRRADVWAVGAMLYHLLSNKLPFEGANEIACLQRLLSGKPPLPLPSSVPKALAEVVKATLVHDPGKRIATCAELQHRLEAAMIEASLRATNADVAAFANRHLADRVKARKEAVDVALAAAAERARVEKVLSLKESASASGEYSLAVTNLGKLSEGRIKVASEPPTRVEKPISNATEAGVETPAFVADSKKRVLAIGGVAALVVVVVVVALAMRKPAAPVAAEPTAAKAAVTQAAAPSASTPTTAPSPAMTAAPTVVATAASAAPTPSVTTTAAKPVAKSGPAPAKPGKPGKPGKPAGDPDDGF